MTVTSSTRKALWAAGSVGLAGRLDVCDESGAAIAAIARELRLTLPEAIGRVCPAEADPVDELKAWRAAGVPNVSPNELGRRRSSTTPVSRWR